MLSHARIPMRCAAILVGAVFISVSYAGVRTLATEISARPINHAATRMATDREGAAQALVQAALVAEIEARDSQRDALLRQALEAAPCCASAHWHLGSMFVNGQWRSLDEIIDLQPPDELVQRYHALARRAGRTVKDQLKLANWCRDVGLKSSERKHLLQAHACKPGLPEIVERLNLRKYRGAWLAANVVERLEEVDRSAAMWDAYLAKIRGDLLSDDTVRRESALARIATIADPLAAPALVSRVSGLNRDAALATVSAFARLPRQPATDSLVKLAVLSPWPEARDAAARALKLRSLYSYAPMLLAGLHAPIEMDVDAYARYGGAATHRVELFQEGPLMDQSLVATTHVRPEIGLDPSRSYRSGPPAGHSAESEFVSVISSADSLSGALGSLDGAQEDAASLAARVTRWNAAARELNERIAKTLNVATDQRLSTEPRLLWKWWCDYNELYVPPVKPVYQQTIERVVKYPTQLQVGAPAAAGTTVQLPTISCFLAGTKVWTPRGTRAIESIQVGDDVLAQDVETGELAFKQVLATTVRPASPILTVNLGSEAFGVTRGHPLWVVGSALADGEGTLPWRPSARRRWRSADRKHRQVATR